MKLASTCFVLLSSVSLPCFAQHTTFIPAGLFDEPMRPSNRRSTSMSQVVVDPRVDHQTRLPGGQALTPLGQILNPDGSVRLDGGFSGALDVQGWQMRTGPDGKPRFLRSAEGGIPEDSLWDDRFGYPGMNNAVFALGVMDTNLYAGGVFTTSGGVSANRIARWNGTSWSALGSGMSGTVFTLAVIGTDLHAGGGFTTAGGVSANYIAKWDGTSWSALGSGMNGAVLALAAIGSELYVGGSFTTAGGNPSSYIGLWHIPDVVGVSEQTPAIPAGYVLGQNYPNPFNPSTKIRFHITTASHVSLRVFDPLGKEVTLLVNEQLSGGSYITEWNATGFASGVYFYRLQAGSFTETKRLVLLR